MGMGGGNNSKFGRSSLSEINVTPMVDVMLVLLIIFMVTAPISKQGLEVELPKTSKAGVVKASATPLMITVKKNKTIYINGKKVKRSNLGSELNKLNKKYKSVHIEAHRLVPYEAVAQTLSTTKSSGFESISLLTEEAL